MMFGDFIFYILLIINIIGFVMFYYDKMMAVKHRRRIPESRLLLVAALGGSFGSMISMFVFRHKTRKTKFMFFVPLFCLFYILLFIIYKNRLG